MRVISGSARGHKLKAPKGLTTRPTTDRIKESLFNILAPDIYGCRFLDLFSGSGAIGIEALSRGAERAVFVDSDRNSLSVIKDNISAVKLEKKAEVIGCDVRTAIMRLSSDKALFDIIFMDPPYKKGYTQETLTYIAEQNILAPDGYIVAEISSEEEIPSSDGLELKRIKDYKTTKMVFFSHKEDL